MSMTIITVGTTNKIELRNSLMEITNVLQTDGSWLGIRNGIDEEYQELPNQPFINMSKFLPFDETGNVLRQEN